jgi:hypothetical protein
VKLGAAEADTLLESSAVADADQSDAEITMSTPGTEPAVRNTVGAPGKPRAHGFAAIGGAARCPRRG